MPLYWLLKRSYLRWQWHHRRVNFGQFCDGLNGAPAWMRRDTTRRRDTAWWWLIRHYYSTRQLWREFLTGED